MNRYVFLFLVVVGAILSSCNKNSTPISHTIKYIASADTFNFSVTYITDTKSVVSEDVTNGWTKTFTITNQSGFPAKLTVKSSSGHHVVADIYVDQVKTATSQSDSGLTTTLYPVP